MSLTARQTNPVKRVSRLSSLAESGAMVRNPIGVFEKYTATLGDTFLFYFGGLKRTLVSSNPVVLQHVLKTNYENYTKSDIQVKRMGSFLGHGLLTSHGQEWLRQRRIIQRGFSPSKLAQLTSIMQQALDAAIQSFDAEVRKGAIDICPEMRKLTFHTVAASLFSTDIKDEEVIFISKTIAAVQEFLVRQIVHPYLLPWYALTGETGKYQRMRRKGDSVLSRQIARRRKDPAPPSDLLQLLLDARYEDGQAMTDNQVLCESMQLLVAGHETSSTALAWMFYLLTQWPEHTEAIRNELQTVVGDAPVQLAHLPKLEYTTRVIEEALRLYPPFWMVDREAIHDDRIGDIRIAAGTTVIVFTYGAHQCAARWIEPRAFHPDRFKPEIKRAQQPFTYLPFGGGPRSCIGSHYAMLQMTMIIAVVLRSYDFFLVPGQEIDIRPMIILRPQHGIRMNFSRR